MSDPYLISGPSFDTVVLDRLKVAVRRRGISSSIAQSMQLHRLEKDIFDELVYGLTAYVLAERLPNVTESETKTFTIETPDTWFQHLKQSLYFRFPRLGWLQRRWPARLTTVSRKCTFTVNLERYRTYPKADIVLPPDRFGQPVHVAVTRKDWLWN